MQPMRLPRDLSQDRMQVAAYWRVRGGQQPRRVLHQDGDALVGRGSPHRQLIVEAAATPHRGVNRRRVPADAQCEDRRVAQLLEAVGELQRQRRLNTPRQGLCRRERVHLVDHKDAGRHLPCCRQLSAEGTGLAAATGAAGGADDSLHIDEDDGPSALLHERMRNGALATPSRPMQQRAVPRTASSGETGADA